MTREQEHISKNRSHQRFQDSHRPHHGRQLKCITKDTAPAGWPALDSACASGPNALKYVTRNALGLITSAGSPEVLYTYAYNPSRRLASVTDNRGPKTLAYTWSGGGRLNKLIDGEGGETNYLYDAVGRLSGIWGPGSVPGASGDYVRFEWDAAGRLVQKRFSNGRRTDIFYNPDNSLLWIGNAPLTVASIAAHIYQNNAYAYTYDGFGARATRRDDAEGAFQEWRYQYDGLNRLTREYLRTNIDLFGYTEFLYNQNAYDIHGNLTNRTNTSLGGSVRSSVYTTDAAHQMTRHQLTGAGGATVWDRTYAYDANGNRISRSENGSVNETYGYDALNRLTTLNGINQFGYDDQGRRIRKLSESYLYDGPDILATYENAAGTILRRTMHGPGIDNPLMVQAGSAKAFLNADAQGSVGAASDAAGKLGWYGFYDAWGMTTSAIYTAGPEPTQRYTGRENAGEALYYYRARYYDPGSARFTQRDPIGLASGQVNPYSYVGNDPVNNTDPFGLLSWPGHLMASYQGSRMIGNGVGTSIQQGLGAANVDFRSGAQGAGPAASAGHAMNAIDPVTSDSYSSEQFEATLAQTIFNSLANRDFNGARHLVGDLPAEGHSGKTWDGGIGPLHIPGATHLKGDWLPSAAVMDNAAYNSAQVSGIEQCGSACSVNGGWITPRDADGGLRQYNYLTGAYSVSDADGNLIASQGVNFSVAPVAFGTGGYTASGFSLFPGQSNMGMANFLKPK